MEIADKTRIDDKWNKIDDKLKKIDDKPSEIDDKIPCPKKEGNRTQRLPSSSSLPKYLFRNLHNITQLFPLLILSEFIAMVS